MTDQRTRRHTLRTLLQVLVAAAGGIPAAAAAFGISTELSAKIAAVLGLLVVVVTAAQNGLEQSGAIPVLLPNPTADTPEPGADGDAGFGVVEVLAIVGVVLGVMLLVGYLHH